jgi:hypothetical protein
VAVPLSTTANDDPSCTHQRGGNTSVDSYQTRLAVCARELAVLDQAISVARDVTGKLPADFLYVRAVVAAEMAGLQKTIEAKRSRREDGNKPREIDLESPDLASLGLEEPKRYTTVPEIEAALLEVRDLISQRELALRKSKPQIDPVRYWKSSQVLHVLRIHEELLTSRRSWLVRREAKASR